MRWNVQWHVLSHDDRKTYSTTIPWATLGIRHDNQQQPKKKKIPFFGSWETKNGTEAENFFKIKEKWPNAGREKVVSAGSVRFGFFFFTMKKNK